MSDAVFECDQDAMRDTTAVPRREAADVELTAFLNAVQGGCRTSFARLYSATSPRLFAVVMKLSRNASEAEEVLQDVYVMVWTRCAQFDANKGKAIHWLAAIARNAATSSLRRRSCRPQSFSFATGDADDPYAGLASPDHQPLDMVIRRRNSEAVRHCLATLPAQQRECLTMAFYDDLTQVEIADQLERPLGTVKTWVRRSMAAMRSKLEAHG